MPAKERVTKHNYYLDIAETVAERSTCLRKKYGAIIVKNDVIILDRLQRRAARKDKLLRPRRVSQGQAEYPARGTV